MTLFVAVEHGECEIILCKFISLWLRTDVVPVSKANGSETISFKLGDMRVGTVGAYVIRIRITVQLRGIKTL